MNEQLDKLEQLILLITELRNGLDYVNEFKMNVDRENEEVEIQVKFRL